LLVDLLVDSRGSRAGFAVEIIEELHVLRRLRECDSARARIGDRLSRTAGR
jgi:hypothetical protein